MDLNNLNLSNLKNLNKKLLNDKAVTVLEVVGGIMLLVWPSGSVSLIFRLLGLGLIAGGAIRIYGYFNKDTEGIDNKFRMIVACVACLVGLSFLINPKWLINSASFILGILLLVYGLYLLYVEKDNKKDSQNENRKDKIGMISPAVIAIIGVVLIIFPKLLVSFGVRAIGIVLLLTAFNQIFDNYNEGKKTE